MNFQHGAYRHLGFLGSEIWRHRKSRAARIYLHTKFCEDSSTGYNDLCVFKMAVGRHLGFFAEVKCGGISFSGTSVLVTEPNFVRICAIATELWSFKWIFKMAAAVILDFSEVKCDVIGSHGRPVSTSTLHTKFCEDSSTGGRVMVMYVFSKWRSAALLDFCGSKIWRYFCFWDDDISLWAKFCANMCNCDRVMAV